MMMIDDDPSLTHPLPLPSQANHGAYVVAGLVGKRLLSLRLFATLPDDNDFSLSSR